MSEKVYFVYGGAYKSEEDAMRDYDGLGLLYEREEIGPYEVAVFTKKDDGKVDIINTRASRRGTGAAWGAAAGGAATVAVVGVLFPFASAGGAAAGAAGGALLANWTKAFSRRDVKEMGEALDQGDFAVVAVAEMDTAVPVEKVLPTATSSEARDVSSVKDLHRYLKDQD